MSPIAHDLAPVADKMFAARLALSRLRRLKSISPRVIALHKRRELAARTTLEAEANKRGPYRVSMGSRGFYIAILPLAER